ncbi:MAG: zeta toxin family protein [Candidatus Omnitrophica bacterium]|nr:zeta toxin family protein [Candidatus Omnitrophota bacterium]
MSKKRASNLYIIAGPNGAGKTTFAKEFLPHYAKCENFVNADLIAQGLSPFSPEAAAMRAGRLLLEQIRLLAHKHSDFGFETTLSGITYVALLRRLKAQGYRIQLFFLWIPTVEMALARIADRVRRGGHDIPERVVRRRFHKGIQNFFTRYRPLLDLWMLFDNSGTKPQLIACEEVGELRVFDQTVFAKIRTR